MTTEKIYPLDCITLINGVLAIMQFISKGRKIDYTRTVILPSGTKLISSEINYGSKDEYSFYFKEKTQSESIKNLYLSIEINDSSAVELHIKIRHHILVNCFQIVERFDFNLLDPGNSKHVMLITDIYINKGLNGLSISKWLLFIDYFIELVTFRQCYSDSLITRDEARRQIYRKISEQIIIRNN